MYSKKVFKILLLNFYILIWKVNEYIFKVMYFKLFCLYCLVKI